MKEGNGIENPVLTRWRLQITISTLRAFSTYIEEQENRIININVSQSYLRVGGLAHELVHGYQFETGQIDFQSTGSPGILYDITHKVSCVYTSICFYT